MKKVLFITSPNLALIEKKPYQDVNLGGVTMIGGLVEYGHEVDHYELNGALNELRFSNETLSDEDINVLMDIDALVSYVENPTNGILTRWIKELVEIIPHFDYDCAAFSVMRMHPSVDLSKMILHLSFLLAIEIRKKIDIIYLGGRQIIKYVGKDYITKLKDLLKEKFPFTLVVDGRAHYSFPKILDEKLTETDLISTDFRDKYPCDIVPLIKAKNSDHVKVNPAKLFGHDILHNHRRINYDQFTIMPWRFSFGCNFRCAFCSDFGTKFEVKPAIEIVDSIEKLVDNGHSYFKFFNTTITSKNSFVYDLCNEIVKRNLKIKFSDSANLLARNHDVYYALSEAGCIKLWFGVETVSDRLLTVIDKPIKHKEDIIEGLEISSKAGIWNCLNFIANFPHETESEFEELKDFIKKYYGTIANSLQINAFELHEESAYYVKPEHFGIEVLENHGPYFSFNETNGLQWKDKYEQGLQRRKEVMQMYDHNENKMNANDGILFAISSSATRDEKKQIFKACYEKYKKDDDVKRFSFD